MKSRFNLEWAAETACVQNDRVVMLILAPPIRLKGTEPCERLESRVNLSLTPQSSHIPARLGWNKGFCQRRSANINRANLKIRRISECVQILFSEKGYKLERFPCFHRVFGWDDSFPSILINKFS